MQERFWPSENRKKTRFISAIPFYFPRFRFGYQSFEKEMATGENNQSQQYKLIVKLCLSWQRRLGQPTNSDRLVFVFYNYCLFLYYSCCIIPSGKVEKSSFIICIIFFFYKSDTPEFRGLQMAKKIIRVDGENFKGKYTLFAA